MKRRRRPHHHHRQHDTPRNEQQLTMSELSKIRRAVIAAGEEAGYVRNCQECGTDLSPDSPDEPLGIFMLLDHLWAIASLDGKIACLCLGCTERALGTRLPPSAFDTDEMFPAWMLTPELRDRLNPETDGDPTLHLDLDPERAEIAARELAALRSKSEEGER